MMRPCTTTFDFTGTTPATSRSASISKLLPFTVLPPIIFPSSSCAGVVPIDGLLLEVEGFAVPVARRAEVPDHGFAGTDLRQLVQNQCLRCVFDGLPFSPVILGVEDVLAHARHHRADLRMRHVVDR